MTVREVEKLLRKDGWVCVATVGSHKQFTHPTKPGKVTVPQHSGDIHLGTLKSILRQAGLS